ncbi:MAG: ABC transporter ATP-binding protein, partial [Candidatus Electrothrix sp. AUS1_2]|nr:ABC transporter ATP-binding protein [Candidatus Electrothrix sp. AUS1_2]
MQHSFGLITEFARNSMVAIRLIKGYTREERQKKAFAELGEQYVAANLKVAVVQGLLFPVAVLVGNLGMLLILYYGGKQVITEAITLGDFVAFVHYLYKMIWPMMAVGWVTNIAQRGVTSLARIHRLLTAESCLEGSLHAAAAGANPCVRPDCVHADCDRPEPAMRHVNGQAQGPAPTIPSVSMRGLNFSYNGAKVPALTGLDLELKPGILGIAGRTGSGKSTLCRLLTRQYPVQDGMLFFADQ